MSEASALLAGEPQRGPDASGFADALEADDLLAGLLGALDLEDGAASLHFQDGGDPLPLHRAGAAAHDDALAAAVMRRNVDFCRRGTASGHDAVVDAIGPEFRDLDAFTFGFPCAESRTCLVVTAVVARKELAQRPLRFAAFRRMRPVLDAAFRLWQRHRKQSRERRGLAVALDAVEFGIVLVDREGEVGFANAAARSVLAEGRFLRRRGGALCANQLRDTMKLQAALAAAIGANGGEGDGAQSSGASLLQLTSGSGRVVVAALPAEQPAEEPGSVAAVLVIHDPDRRYERAVAPVCKLFGLSAVETRLATHLVSGHSVAEASAMMRIKEQTARGYLKQVFLKVNVKRQSDLVRLLLSSLLSTRVRAALHAV